MVKIQTVSHRENIDELVNLVDLSFGSKMPKEFWEWKYILNPFGQKDLTVVATENGKIIGARPYIPFQMWVNNAKVKTLNGGDGMVHPDYQRRGIFTKMTQFAFEYYTKSGYSFMIGFPNQKSAPGGIKVGYKILSNVETLFYPVNPGKLISTKLYIKFLPDIMGFLYKTLFLSMPKLDVSSEEYEIKNFSRYNDEIIDIDELRDKSSIDIVRSEDYLKWRFDQHPKFNYEYIIAKKNDQICGYAVISKQKRSNGIVNGRIIDYLIKDNDINCFKAIINKCVVKLLECDNILIWAFTNPDLRRVLIKDYNFKSSIDFPRASGAFKSFINYPYTKLKKRTLLIVKELNKLPPGSPDVFDKKNYRFTLIYPDVT